MKRLCAFVKLRHQLASADFTRRQGALGLGHEDRKREALICSDLLGFKLILTGTFSGLGR